MVSDAKGILLRLSAEKETRGSFRIVGKARGKPGIERTASAILKDFGATADLWLTATPGKTGAKK